MFCGIEPVSGGHKRVTARFQPVESIATHAVRARLARERLELDRRIDDERSRAGVPHGPADGECAGRSCPALAQAQLSGHDLRPDDRFQLQIKRDGDDRPEGDPRGDPQGAPKLADGVPPIDLRHQGRRRIGLADQRPLEIGLRDRAKAAEPCQRLPEQLMLLRRSLRPALARPGRDQVAAIDPQGRRPFLVGAVLERVDRLRIAQLPVLAHLVQEQVEGGPVRRILLVRRLETDVGLAQRLGRLRVLDDCIEGAVEVLKHRSSSNVHRQTFPPPAPSGADARPIAMIANPRGATRWRFLVSLPRRHRASEAYGHRAGWARSESRERSYRDASVRGAVAPFACCDNIGDDQYPHVDRGIRRSELRPGCAMAWGAAR